MLFLLVALLALACGVPLVLLVSWLMLGWRRVRGAPQAGDRRTARRIGAGLGLCLGLGILAVAAALPSVSAFKDPVARICFDRGTPAELVGIVGQEATRADPERVWWPWGFRCTWSHYAYNGTIVDEPGWGSTVLGGVGAVVVAAGATTLVRTRRNAGAPERA